MVSKGQRVLIGIKETESIVGGHLFAVREPKILWKSRNDEDWLVEADETNVKGQNWGNLLEIELNASPSEMIFHNNPT